jgi:hypothetical protein
MRLEQAPNMIYGFPLILVLETQSIDGKICLYLVAILSKHDYFKGTFKQFFRKKYSK